MSTLPVGGFAPGWRRNQAAAVLASFIGFTAFTLVMPFLPLYIEQLGVSSAGDAALWAGVSLGVTPALAAILSPLWGRIADRFGRKIMVERSLASFVVIMGAMAFVTRPWHVLALRTIQGIFAGYGALTLAMAAESAPPGRMASAIGLVQTAQRLGPAIGPVIGGAISSLVGLRQTFFVTAACYLVAFILVLLMYREEPGGRSAERTAEPHAFRSVFEFPNFLLAMTVLFGLQYVDRSFSPILPMLLAYRGVPAASVPLRAGLLFSVLACSAAAGNFLYGRLWASGPPRRVIAAGALVGAIAVAVLAARADGVLMAVAFAAFGVGVGAGMTAAYTAAGSAVPAAVRGGAFGLLTSSALIGLAVSPAVNGLLARFDLRLVFLVNLLVMIGLAALVQRLMIDAAAAATSPRAEDA